MIAYIRKNGYFGFNKDGDFIALGYDIAITAVKKNLDTGNVTLEVAFIVGKEVTKAELNYNNMKEILNAKGYAISNDNEKHIKAFLHQQMHGKAPIQVYDNLGWCKVDGKYAFKSDILITAGNKSAVYQGQYDVKPHGTKEAFINSLKDVIVGNTPLETAAVIGLSACVVGYISNFITIDTIICNMYGSSTTGKTTAANLAISMGCNIEGDKSKQSLAMNCSTTKNALLGSIANNNGYPVLFDELGRLDKKTNLSQLVYDIADGTDKARMSKDGKIKPKSKWATTVIFTGEFSLLDVKSAPKGTEIRVLSFPYVEWTKDEKQAENVKQFSRQYGGMGIKLLAEGIVKEEKGLVQLYEKYVDEIKKEIPIEETYRARVAKYVAILKLTAELASYVYGVKFNTMEIIKFVYYNLKRQSEADVNDEAYEYVVGCIHKYMGMFDSRVPQKIKHCMSTYEGRTYETKVTHSSTYGYVKYVDDEDSNYTAEKCVVLTTVVEKWLEKGCFVNITSILQCWRKRGYLLTKDSTHLKSKRTISPSGPYASCYIISLEGKNIQLPIRVVTDTVISDSISPKNKFEQTATEGGENP